MAVLYLNPGANPDAWRRELARNLPDMDIRVWPDEVGDPAEIHYAVVWKPPAGELRRFANLKGIMSLGAGVDHVFSDTDLPPGVPISRLVDRALTVDMTHYVVHWAIHFHRDLHRYPGLQARATWNKLPYPEAANRGVGVLGLGVLGGDAAQALAALGFKVAGWSRRPKDFDGVESFHGDDGLIPFLERTEILVCLLPLTPATDHILNAARLATLPRGAFLINAARGDHIVEADLIAALDSGHLAAAALDVFQPEPLPAGHPFWGHDKIFLTPHIASHTTPRTAAHEISLDIRRIEAGQPARHEVDPARKY